MYNKVILHGNLTRDPEIRYTQGGTAVCNFGLAVNRTWKNEAGEKQEECSFFDIVAFGRQAETVSQYLKKGKPLLLDGRLKQEVWPDKKTGENRYAVKVILESFTFVGDGSKRGDEPQEREASPQRESGGGYRSAGREQPKQDVKPAVNDDDQIPF